MKKTVRLFATLSLAATSAITIPVLAPEARAAAPASIRVQGYVSDRSGGPPVPANGVFAMGFSLFDALQAGSLVASAGPLQVTVQNGLYNAEVPFPATAFAGPSLFLEVTINGEILAPRIPVVSVPFAYVANQAAAVAPGSIVAESLAPGAVTLEKIGIPCANGQVLVRQNGAWVCGAPGCNAGDAVVCYTGAAGTLGVGPCRVGIRTCQGGAGLGPCVGEVAPVAEVCDGIDNDCNGVVDVGCNVCGNGVTEFSETCDDGNANPGDGCSATCLVEPNYNCTGTPSVCVYVCQANQVNCDGDNANGCECAGTVCCGTACAPPHQNGLGQTYTSCSPLGVPGNPATYGQALASQARAGWPVTGSDFQLADFCGAGLSAVLRQAPSQCAVWVYTGSLAGYVRLNSASSTCLCPTAASPTWN
ncbi:MAG TPA: hypothetical protein VJV75_13145 [Candidatus Polarisedimenticolia bacterium]|nr:hypothetical protein [Candidatus Polarisedimenticolia bacterium]